MSVHQAKQPTLRSRNLARGCSFSNDWFTGVGTAVAHQEIQTSRGRIEASQSRLLCISFGFVEGVIFLNGRQLNGDSVAGRITQILSGKASEHYRDVVLTTTIVGGLNQSAAGSSQISSLGNDLTNLFILEFSRQPVAA